MMGSERFPSHDAICKTTAARFFFLFLTPTAEHPWVACSLSVFQQVQELSLLMLAHPPLFLLASPLHANLVLFQADCEKRYMGWIFA